MIKAKAILPIFLALFALARCLNTEVLSSLKEKTSKSFKKPISLDQAHIKCAEQLKTELGEFLQKVPKEINNDGTQKLGKLVEDKLNKEINLLMGSCDPATVGVAQLVNTKVEPKGNSLTVQQLVIQKIHLTPNLKAVKNVSNCSSTGSVGERGLMSKSDCDDLVAEWERLAHQLEAANITLRENELRLTAQLAELTKLREENEALIRSLNSSHFQDVAKIQEDVSEINRLKTALEENNRRFSEEKINFTRQIENLNSQLNQTNPLKPELEQCKLERDNCKSIQVNNLQNSNKLILSNCNKSISSIQSSLNEQKEKTIVIQGRFDAIKIESENCKNLVRQMEANCTKMVNDATEKVKTCESAKNLCEISTSSINQTLARCKEDGAVIATDYSKKTAAIATCEIDKAKSANDLIACLTTRNTLAKAIAGKIKIQEQLDQINLRNKDTDLSLLTVISPLSDTSQQSIARIILDEKSAWKLKTTTCTP